MKRRTFFGVIGAAVAAVCGVKAAQQPVIVSVSGHGDYVRAVWSDGAIRLWPERETSRAKWLMGHKAEDFYACRSGSLVVDGGKYIALEWHGHGMYAVSNRSGFAHYTPIRDA